MKTTYTDDGVEFLHGNLLGPLNSSRNLLLMLHTHTYTDTMPRHRYHHYNHSTQILDLHEHCGDSRH